MFTTDHDGYIRICRDVLGGVALVHLTSGHNHPEARGRDPTVTGYTEWMTKTLPAISVSWDWRMDTAPLLPIRIGTPYSNVMAVDEQGKDMGEGRSALLLEEIVDRLCWQDEVLRAVMPAYT
jgi:hypothetical protein